MEKTNRYALWLMPEGIVYARAYAIIKHLHKRFDSPKFEPHITLLSGIEMSEDNAIWHAEKLNDEINSIPIRLTKPAYGNDYYHCFFLNADLSQPLVSARQKALSLFETPDSTPFEPHMSLLYGDIDLPVKKSLVEEYGHLQRWEFIVDHIDLVRTGDDIEEWDKVGSYSIKS